VFSSSLFEAAVETAQRIWQLEPVRRVRMPEPNVQQTVAINVLWTDGGLRPRANNLAFLIQQVVNREDLERWKQRLKVWTVRGGLFVLDELYLYLVQPLSDSSNELIEEQLDLTSWDHLISSKPYLFTPKKLAENKQGQLSLADLEEVVSERSFTFLTRQQSRIDGAFQQGIDAAIKAINVPQQDSFSTQIQGHVIRYSIAYLAARILQDKNFFGSGTTIHHKDQDPITLLNWMIDRANGFFREAKKSEAFIFEHARPSFDPMRDALIQHMGYSVSFVLTDHRDVGRLYEEAIKKLPRELSSDDLGDLNRHYTPVMLAERMLEALPLERIRPEERFIFDPAAGSGSLLLAATSRLAGMMDIPTGDERSEYLRSHVAGNDLDRYASLIAQLRYFLASESLGIASETAQISGVLPFPFESNFTHKNYESLGRDDLPLKPKVIVANPPFAEEGKIQKAARFIQKAMEWMDDGSQFAFVLPQSFLVSSTHGVPNSRTLLDSRCQILEVWQYPEGSIGTSVHQDTCVVLGTVDNSKRNIYTLAKAVFSRVDTSEISEKGFAGKTWIAKSRQNQDSFSWASVTSPLIFIERPTISLESIFVVFAGVTPLKGHKPIENCPPNVTCKLNWQLYFRKQGRLWANPLAVPPSKKWIKYGSEYLKRTASESADLLDLPKILVGRAVNRGSIEPLQAHLDTVGLCPDGNLFCLVPIEETGKYNNELRLPIGWNEVSGEEKRLWLLGILSSELANELSLKGRNSRALAKDLLCKLPLPGYIDRQIIDITRQIVLLEQDDLFDNANHDQLRSYLNQLVEESYGYPQRIRISRTGRTPELEQWQLERKNRTLTVTGQILEISQERAQVLLRLSGLLDDKQEDWMPLPQELPGWALDGTVFRAELSEDIETFQELAQRPWALRKFRHTPYPYLNNDELQAKLGRMISLENH
jgi:N-6 DNA Methylase